MLHQTNQATFDLRKEGCARIIDNFRKILEEKKQLRETEMKEKANMLSQQRLLRKFTKMFKTEHDLTDLEDKDSALAKLACLYDSEVKQRKSLQEKLIAQSESGRDLE